MIIKNIKFCAFSYCIQLPFPGKYIVSSLMEYSVPGIVNTHPNTVSGLKSSSDKVLKTDTSYNPFSLFFETVVVWPRLFPELKYFKVSSILYAL